MVHQEEMGGMDRLEQWDLKVSVVKKEIRDQLVDHQAQQDNRGLQDYVGQLDVRDHQAQQDHMGLQEHRGLQDYVGQQDDRDHQDQGVEAWSTPGGVVILVLVIPELSLCTLEEWGEANTVMGVVDQTFFACHQIQITIFKFDPEYKVTVMYTEQNMSILLQQAQTTMSPVLFVLCPLDFKFS